MKGYLREDGRKGIRNNILIVYLVECAHHVAKEIAYPFKDQMVQVIGFGGCYPNKYADKVMKSLCTHPNTGAVLLVSLGCESFDRYGLSETIAQSGRPVSTIVIQQEGGTRSSVQKGREWVTETLKIINEAPTVEIGMEDLIIGTICGGSDATSGISANPAVGLVFDEIVKDGGTAIFEETGEMIGCFADIIGRTGNPVFQTTLKKSLEKAALYYTAMGHGSFAPGNADGGLTTIEEKSLGAYSKIGSRDIMGLIKPGDRPAGPGLYLLDIVPDGEPRFGFPNINDSSEIAELISCGCHIILFTTGRGSVVGSAIAPVIKICGNPETYARMSEDMDINAGKIINENKSLEDVAGELYHAIKETASGVPTKSEALGHQEFVLTYKTFEPIGPECLA